MKLIDSLIVEKNWKQKSKIATNKTIIDLFSKYNPKVLFQPNEKWEYSNTGYALLASIIEKVSGKSYAEFLKNEIFFPLKMENTFIHRRRYEPKKIKNYAFGYVSDSLKHNVLPDEVKTDNLDKYVYSMDGIVGDGTVNSTITDLLKWDRALYTKKLISEKSKIETFSEGILNDKTKTDYGFGWELKSNGIFGRILSHGGSWPGYKTYIERHIENDKTIIMLQNNDNENIFYPIKQIREILYNIKPTKIINLENSEKEFFAGSYKTDKNDLRNIEVENGKLLIVFDPNDKMELKPISKTKFIVEGFSPDVYYEFIIENGKVEKYIMTQPELKNSKEAIKVK
jgi:CubicO group peptidase (beta-lactamase class C family)